MMAGKTAPGAPESFPCMTVSGQITSQQKKKAARNDNIKSLSGDTVSPLHPALVGWLLVLSRTSATMAHEAAALREKLSKLEWLVRPCHRREIFAVENWTQFARSGFLSPCPGHPYFCKKKFQTKSRPPHTTLQPRQLPGQSSPQKQYHCATHMPEGDAATCGLQRSRQAPFRHTQGE